MMAKTQSQKSKQTRRIAPNSPDGTWTPVPREAYTVQTTSIEEARLEMPILDEIVPVDHRTPWGSELLGFAGLEILKEYFNCPFFMRNIRQWTREHGIDWREIEATPLPWTEFLSILRTKCDGEGQNDGRQSDRKAGRHVTHDDRTLSRMKTAYENALADGLDSKAAYAKVAETFEAPSGEAVRQALYRWKNRNTVHK